jgi:peptidyl-prolyl cis-trans isomerase SurA
MKLGSRLTVLVFLCFSYCFAQQSLGGITAIVGDKIILKSEVVQIVQMTALNMGIDPNSNEEQIKNISEGVLQSLIDQHLVLSVAEAESVIVSSREVDEALERHIASVLTRAGSEGRLEEIFGKSLRELKRELWPDIHDQLVVERFQSQLFSGVVISRKEVEDFFSTYKDSIGVLPELYDIQWLRLSITPGRKSEHQSIENLDEIRQRIVSGEDFSSLASQYSQDPGSARNGGELGFTARGTLVPEYEEVALGLSGGEVSGVIRSPFGFHIIQMIERMGEKMNTRHILLIPLPSEADEDSVYVLASALADSINTSKELSVFAAKYSDDGTSKERGGHLGFQNISSLPYPGLAQVIPKLKMNELSTPIWVKTAYFLIMINNIRPGGEPSLGVHWAEIESLALGKKKSDFFSSWLSKKSSSVYIKVFE